MITICNECQERYDDAERSTICPHNRFLSVEHQNQKDLAISLIGKKLRFAHQVDDPNGKDVSIMSVGWDGMVTLFGWSGEFAPHLFVEVK